MRKIKLLTLLFLASIAIVCTSCSDMLLANNIDGTWKTNFSDEDDDAKLDVELYMKFETTDRFLNHKGNLAEVFDGSMDLGEGLTYNFKCYVEGTWEIKDGELYVDLDAHSLKLKFDGVDEIKQELTDEMRKEIKKDSEDSYEDLDIDGDRMELKDSDYGKLRFKKIDKDIDKIFREGDDDDDSSDDDSSDATATDSAVGTTTMMPGGSSSDGNISSSDENAIAKVVGEWDELHNDNDIDEVDDVFAPTVEFYGQTLSRGDVATKIRQLCNSTPDFNQNSHNLSYKVLGNGDVMVEFTKSTLANGRRHDYPSYLVLKRSSNDYGWSIIKESDLVTDRNLQK